VQARGYGAVVAVGLGLQEVSRLKRPQGALLALTVLTELSGEPIFGDASISSQDRRWALRQGQRRRDQPADRRQRGRPGQQD
jgi:hypothetical protein